MWMYSVEAENIFANEKKNFRRLFIDFFVIFIYGIKQKNCQ